MIVILLLAIAANAYGDAYATGPSAQSQVAPASAAYGSPYSSNLNSAALQPQPIQVQPFSPFMQHSVPFEMQRAGVSAYPIGYGMFGPMQQGHHPYQMYSQQTLPNPFFVSYPQNMETYGAIRQSQQTSVPAVPSGASAYLTLPTQSQNHLTTSPSTPPRSEDDITRLWDLDRLGVTEDPDPSVDKEEDARILKRFQDTAQVLVGSHCPPSIYSHSHVEPLLSSRCYRAAAAISHH
ncbi:hypothetical protein NECAME_08583 [Necator americanus]|uniref:Uncharacterized protein n=1 Tax=Necator americanus TaxID=51031 RepID=W2TJJ0_NECAM|nr:hypothetical protein NECAME_08583 [Necator americanus]ETN81326.1 hypothetical protein NECAME_08583 [Necator americanus]